MNTDAILDGLSQIRDAIPQIPQPRPEIEANPAGVSLDDFEYSAIADTLQAMGDDLAAAIADAKKTLAAKCLEVYYTAEELSRDPAHADLIPCVEEMRRTYERSYGNPIPAEKL